MTTNIKNARVFKVKYFGATNTKGSRFKLVDLRQKKAIWLYKDYKYNSGVEQCINYLKGLGIETLFKAEYDDKTDLIITNNWEVWDLK